MWHGLVKGETERKGQKKPLFWMENVNLVKAQIGMKPKPNVEVKFVKSENTRTKIKFASN